VNLARTIAPRLQGFSLWHIDVAGLGLCAMLATLWYYAGVRPLSEAAASREVLQGELAARDARYDEAVRARSEQQQKAIDLQKQIDSDSIRLLTLDQLNARIAALNTLAKSYGLRIDEVRPASPVILPRYTTVAIHLAGAGTYADGARFLHALRTDLRDTGIVGFELRGEPEAPDKTPTFSFHLLWYAAPSARPDTHAKK
jgi:Tfp pilus assembly protein PilO